MSLTRRLHRIRASLHRTMLQDREIISQRLKKLEIAIGGAHEDKRRLGQLIALEKRLDASLRERERRRACIPEVTFPEVLPIFKKKDEIIEAIRKNQVIIISGETGSGKSTQIPKMCLEAGRGVEGKIGCTQPRRIAATTIGRRIAEEMGEELGESVGYKIRFREKGNRDTYIKIMTDGILLAETQQDPRLFEYDTLIVDEAHERSLNIDFILGILKTLLVIRPELKLIITSATLDTQKFSHAFDNAPVIEVSGRLYPVEVEYCAVNPDLEDAGDVTYVDMAVKAVDDLRKKKRIGDILIFMPTEQDIRETCDRLEGRQLSGTTILPLFARLPVSEQGKVYSVKGQKIVVATNVAETSLTIPGIKYVIDTGLARISRYLPSSRTTSLPISPISKSSADQRKGRCGRMRNGICIRLYTEEDYESRSLFTTPEILRANLAEVILRMISLNLDDVETFPFLDRPGPKNIKDGFDLLVELGAIRRGSKRSSLTEKGRIMAKMPLDPKISRMMIEAQNEGCVRDVAVIASALSIQDPRERPLESAEEADRMHAPFKDPDSDFLTLLNIWNRYHRTWERLRTQNKMRKFCKQHFLSFPRMREWIHIHDQITTILREQKISLGSKRNGLEISDTLYAGIHRSILSGYLSNIAQKKDKNIYSAAKGREAMIFPGSGIFNKAYPWIVAAEMIKTSRLFARTAARIESEWLEALGGSLCKSHYSNPRWEKNREEVRATERVTLFGMVIIPRRAVSYGPINPVEAHEIFVKSALVDGDMKHPPPFLVHNLSVIKDMAKLEDKVRRRGILATEHEIAAFYSEKLPGVYNRRSLEKVIKEMGGDDFLKLTEKDLLRFHPDEQELALYPDQIVIGESRFRTSYKFAPGKEEDGVTIAVPSSLVSRIPAGRLEWGVPGLFREKVTALLRGLPKRYRKQLVPVTSTVDVIANEMEQNDEPLITALARFVYRRFGVDIPASVWSSVEIPEHLKMRISVTDHRGRELESARDIRLLGQMGLSSETEPEPEIWKRAQAKWEKTGITSWNFDSLPESIPFGPHLIAYPGLEAGDGDLNIRLFREYEAALAAHKDGVQKLFSLRFAKDLKFLKRSLCLPGEGVEAARYFGGERAVEGALFRCVTKNLFHENLRDRRSFDAHAERVGPEMFAKGHELRDQAVLIMKAYHRARAAIHGIEKASGTNRDVLTLCTQIREDLSVLIPEDFLDRYPLDRLVHLPRYLKAMEKRGERGAHDPLKDRNKMAEAAVFIEALNTLRHDMSPHASREKREALESFRWMVEEFKVSLFAQELKTPYPVSKKRLQEKQKEIERMV